MDYQIGNPKFLWLLGIVACGGLLVLFAMAARLRARHKFATANLAARLMPVARTGSHSMSALLVASALSLMAIALVDIRWGKTAREVPQKGLEVVFVLDVSRSMLAEDTSPNRLVRARQQIGDMLDEMAGDRVGLVIFAGESRLQVPLTSHYDDFRQTLESVGPQSLRRGGSRLGDALETAANAFLAKTNEHRTIVIFTDGEDQESQPVDVAARLHKELGIRIFTIGLGDINHGSRIPDPADSHGFVEYDGEPVLSKLNGEILQKIATESEGAFVPAGTRRVDMGQVYQQFVANVPQTEFETATIDAWVPRYQWFAALALLLLLTEIFVSTRDVQPAKGKGKGKGIRNVAASVVDHRFPESPARNPPKVREKELVG